MKKVSKPLKAAAAALLFVGALSICPNFSQAQEAKQILKGLFDLIDQAQKSKHQGRNRNNDQPPSEKSEDPTVDPNPSAYSVGGMRLGERTTLEKTFNCKPSDQFRGYNWCSKRSFESSGRGNYQQRTSLLLSQHDDVIAYVNRELSPAFFAPNEIQDDIDQLTSSFKSQPKILTMPQRPGLPSGTIATWGNVALEPLDESSLKILAEGESPKKGILADFLNDLAKSAKERLPVYRLAGSAGYVWIATHEKNGRGKLRFFAVDASALNGQSTLVADKSLSQAVDQANTDSTTSNSSGVKANEDAAGPQQAQLSEAERSAESAKIDEENRATAERAAQSAPPEWKQNYLRSSEEKAVISSNATSTSAVSGSELEQSIAAATRKIRQEADDAASLRRQQFEIEQKNRRVSFEADVERRRRMGSTTASPEEIERFDQQQQQALERFLATREQEWQSVENYAERQVESKIASETARIHSEADERERAEKQREEQARQDLKRQQEAAEKEKKETEEQAQRLEAFNTAEKLAQTRGPEYAASSGTSWSANSTKDELTDKVQTTATSVQTNDNGAVAEVTGRCVQPGKLEFTALVVDGSGKPTVTIADEQAGQVPGFASQQRVNDEPVRSTILAKSSFDNQVALATVHFPVKQLDAPKAPEKSDAQIFEKIKMFTELVSGMMYGPGILAGQTTWRILTEINTSNGKLLIRLPMFDPSVRQLAVSCGAPIFVTDQISSPPAVTKIASSESSDSKPWLILVLGLGSITALITWLSRRSNSASIGSHELQTPTDVSRPQPTVNYATPASDLALNTGSAGRNGILSRKVETIDKSDMILPIVAAALVGGYLLTGAPGGATAACTVHLNFLDSDPYCKLALNFDMSNKDSKFSQNYNEYVERHTTSRGDSMQRRVDGLKRERRDQERRNEEIMDRADRQRQEFRDEMERRDQKQREIYDRGQRQLEESQQRMNDFMNR